MAFADSNADSRLAAALSSSWSQLCESSSISKEVYGTWWSVISNHYNEPWRYYHTLKHIQELLALSETFKGKLNSKATVDFAIWFHDLIYDGQAKDNEEQSDLLWKKFALEATLPKPMVDDVSTFIMATKSHKVDATANSDLNYFLDFDLSILAREEHYYDAYASQIRKEYIHYPEKLYCEGRAKVLTGLGAGGLFLTEDFRLSSEQKAKDNLAREVGKLKKRSRELQDPVKVGFLEIPYPGRYPMAIKDAATNSTLALYIRLTFPESSVDCIPMSEFISNLCYVYELVTRVNLDLDLRVIFTEPNQASLPLPSLQHSPNVIWGSESLSSDSRFKALASLQEPSRLNHTSGSSSAPRQSGRVNAVGGTFDRLHAGHKVLLTVAALSTTDTLIVGISDGPLLKNKKYREMVESFEVRQKKVVDFVADVNPKIKVDAVQLLEPAGPTTTREDIDLLIVSEETLSGATLINKDRSAKGWKSLGVVVISLIGNHPDLDSDANNKISSTTLRKRDFERQQRDKQRSGANA